MSRLVALAAAVLFSLPSDAAGQQAQDMKAMLAKQKKCMADMSAQVSKVSFDRRDVEKYLAEYKSFDAFDEDDTSEEKPDGPECLDISTALADGKYVAWARERNLDPKAWLLKSMRITLTFLKHRAPAQAAETKAEMEAQRRELEKSCKSMGPNACRDMRQAFAAGEELMRESTAMMAALPEPSRAEAALLVEYAERLRKAVEDDDDEDGRGGRRSVHDER